MAQSNKSLSNKRFSWCNHFENSIFEQKGIEYSNIIKNTIYNSFLCGVERGVVLFGPRTISENLVASDIIASKE